MRKKGFFRRSAAKFFMLKVKPNSNLSFIRQQNFSKKIFRRKLFTKKIVSFWKKKICLRFDEFLFCDSDFFSIQGIPQYWRPGLLHWQRSLSSWLIQIWHDKKNSNFDFAWCDVVTIWIQKAETIQKGAGPSFFPPFWCYCYFQEVRYFLYCPQE